MPYEMKNRFLILGLTGPLGSGCTETALFLSGNEREGNSLSDVLNKHISEKSKEMLRKRITNKYDLIYQNKELISKRERIELGPYKNLIINPSEDILIQEKERKNIIEHNKLKQNLVRREINQVLNDFSQDKVFGYQNINDDDISLFGFKPFIYISFTLIIIKLAFEAFIKDKKTNFEEFNTYFDRKINNANEGNKNGFHTLKKLFYDNFSVGINNKKYETSNQYMRNRIYKIFRPEQLEIFDREKFKEFSNRNKNITKNFYNYIKFLKNILINVKANSTLNHKESLSYCLSEVLQDWGDNIRAKGNPFLELLYKEKFQKENLFKLSKEINNLIKFLRHRIRFLNKDFSTKKRIVDFDKIPSLFVVECFRNPYEIEFFRSRYSEFYLLSISCERQIREQRVKHFSQERDGRDQGLGNKSGELYKLDVRKCVLLSDIALLNNYSKDTFYERLIQYLALIRSPGCYPPSINELYMHLAYSHSLMSTCISRKVGAVIRGPKGYIYAAGWNDVGEGQIGCGIRRKEDFSFISNIPKVSSKYKKEDFDRLVHQKNGNYICYKDIMSKLEFDNKLNKLSESKECQNKCIEKIESEISIKRLEYCRALHAEENALLQITKIGGLPVKGGTIYTTTYPCELCAKKLYQSGIRTIYYTEPYPETISEEVFLEDGNRKIQTYPFEGVKSQSFYRLFKPIFDKKDIVFVQN